MGLMLPIWGATWTACQGPGVLNSSCLRQWMANCIYHAPCTHMWWLLWVEGKGPKLVSNFSPPPDMEKERKENNKMKLFVISPHLISHRKETPQGLGEITLELSPKGSLCSPRKRVFIRSSLLPSRWNLSAHTQLTHNLYWWKLPCEMTVLTGRRTPRAKMGDTHANKKRCSINTTPQNPAPHQCPARSSP